MKGILSMIGAIIGDIVGSVYEWNNIKTKDFPFFRQDCFFTDDTVMTCAVYQAIWKFKEGRSADLSRTLTETLRFFGRNYPGRGYGGRFQRWLLSEDWGPYNSFGNGAAMRVSAPGLLAETLDEARALAQASAEVTHDHPEGIKGAVATAEGIFLGHSGASLDEIRAALSAYYDLDFTLDAIRPSYHFDETCQGTVPQAIVALLESNGFEDAIRNAISIGGDSDTLAAVTGSLAEGVYGVPEVLRRQALSFLDERLRRMVLSFSNPGRWVPKGIR